MANTADPERADLVGKHIAAAVNGKLLIGLVLRESEHEVWIERTDPPCIHPLAVRKPFDFEEVQ